MAWAQLEVRLEVERDNFVRHEPVILDVSIVSNHDRAIILGNEAGWIQFSVRNGAGFPVNKTAPLPRGNLFVLGSRKSVVKGFNLAPYFDFSEPGEYTIQTSIATSNWATVRFQSVAVKIQVVRAKVLSVRKRGTASVIPGAPPVVRRYTLQTTRVKGKSHLFLRVSDDNEPSFKIYSVEPLGMMVHSARPAICAGCQGSLARVLPKPHAAVFLLPARSAGQFDPAPNLSRRTGATVYLSGPPGQVQDPRREPGGGAIGFSSAAHRVTEKLKASSSPGFSTGRLGRFSPRNSSLALGRCRHCSAAAAAPRP